MILEIKKSTCSYLFERNNDTLVLRNNNDTLSNNLRLKINGKCKKIIKIIGQIQFFIFSLQIQSSLTKLFITRLSSLRYPLLFPLPDQQFTVYKKRRGAINELEIRCENNRKIARWGKIVGGRLNEHAKLSRLEGIPWGRIIVTFFSDTLHYWSGNTRSLLRVDRLETAVTRSVT